MFWISNKIPWIPKMVGKVPTPRDDRKRPGSCIFFIKHSAPNPTTIYRFFGHEKILVSCRYEIACRYGSIHKLESVGIGWLNATSIKDLYRDISTTLNRGLCIDPAGSIHVMFQPQLYLDTGPGRYFIRALKIVWKNK